MATKVNFVKFSDNWVQQVKISLNMFSIFYFSEFLSYFLLQIYYAELPEVAIFEM